MRAEELGIIINNNIGMIFKDEEYKKFMTFTVYMTGYDFLNKFLIYFQNRNATEVKNEVSWRNEGRVVKDLSKSIWIIEEDYKGVYVDSETGERVDAIRMSLKEVSRAAKLGVIKKVNKSNNYKSCSVYDIENTYIKEEGYKRSTDRQIKISNIINEINKQYNIEVAYRDGDTAFSKENNTMYIGNDSTEAKIKTLLSVLIDLMVDNMEIKDVIKSNRMYGNWIKESVLYSILNSLKIRFNVSFKYIESLYNSNDGDDKKTEVINIMTCIESIKDTIFSICSDIPINSWSTHKVKLAETILNAITANDMYKSIKRELG